MASIFPFPFQSDWARVATLCIAFLVSTSVHANPANCDGEMTEDQRFQAELCSAHAGCRFVFGIADTCTKAKSFLSKLGLGGRGSATKVTDDRVSYALAETGVPPSGISSCLYDFDRAKCKEYLSGGPKQPSAKDQADEIVKRLNSKVYSTTVWDAGLGLAKEGLLMCDDATNEAKMRDAVRAKERCALAEGNIRACLSTKEGHDELRTKLQNLIDNGGLGVDAVGYRSLANTPYPECPTTLPSSGKTPKVALADYLKFWDTSKEKSEEAQSTEKENKANSVIARCDAMRRDISDALDNSELDRTSGLIDQFKAACSRENQTYADLTRLYKQRLTEARAAQETTALPRRGGSSGAEMFQQAINQAEQEEKNRPAREARERAAKAAAVAAEARQTPEDRLRKNYDQRITAAREQCTASKESCDSGCTGVAVVGLLTMFASKGAGADVASSQIQQCSNRCDGAKSSCDEQVSNLEQERSQAVAGARNPQRPTASSSGVAQAPSGGGARGLPVEECHRQANASNLGDKLNAIPRSDTVLLLRGAIHNLDFLIRTYTQCLPEQGSQNAINGWKTQREQSLRTCRQISSSDNCLDSPFIAAAARQDSSPVSLPKPQNFGTIFDKNGKCLSNCEDIRSTPQTPPKNSRGITIQ